MREQHVAYQELHQRQLRSDHVKSRVKCCRRVKDRRRLWKVGGRARVRDLCCALPHAGIVNLMQKITHLCSKERTIGGFVLPRTPVFSPLTPLKFSQGKDVWKRFA